MECFYTELGINFKFIQDKHMYINLFGKDEFYNNVEDWVSITKGSKKYEYCNLYEILLWYYYYSIKHKHIKKKYKSKYIKRELCMNRSYFSRIPYHYKQIDPKKGLNIAKDAIDIIIKRHNGIPLYYDKNIINFLFTVK